MRWKKTEGGSGGKIGHSNMSHFTTTEEIKAECKKVRRQKGKRIIKAQLKEMEEEK